MRGLNYLQAWLPSHVLCWSEITDVQCLFRVEASTAMRRFAGLIQEVGDAFAAGWHCNSRRVVRATEEPVFRQFSPAWHLLFVDPPAGLAPPDLRRTDMAFVHRHFLHPGFSGATDAQRYPVPMGIPSLWRVYCGLRVYAFDGSDRVVKTGVLVVWQRQGRDCNCLGRHSDRASVSCAKDHRDDPDRQGL